MAVQLPISSPLSACQPTTPTPADGWIDAIPVRKPDSGGPVLATCFPKSDRSSSGATSPPGSAAPVPAFDAVRTNLLDVTPAEAEQVGRQSAAYHGGPRID
jgi:hypothetical protein